MEDMERYAEYNDTGDVPGKKSPLAKLFITFIVLVIVLVVGVLGYRLYLFEYYPAEMKTLAFTDALTAYYNKTQGQIEVYTQDIRFPYDDTDIDTVNNNDLGTFFVDHLLLIPSIDELQITLRVNVAGLTEIGEIYVGEGADPDATLSLLKFRLTDDCSREYTDLVYVDTAEKSMYRYIKLAFDGVALTSPADEGDAPAWIRLEIFYEDSSVPYSYTLIYENNDQYNTVTPYHVSTQEKPQ